MTFKDIAIKNFKGNMKKYITYFLCNSFIVAAFFMYSVLMFNEKLMNSSQVEKGVMEALIVPNVALGVFSLFFVSYAHSSFIKWRKKEFGVFMTLGMTHEDIRKIIIYENSIVALGSILLGLIAGVVFSRLFFIIIMKLLEIEGIRYTMGIKNFIFPCGIFLIIYLGNLLVTVVATYNFEIIKLLKDDRKVQSNRFSNPILAVVGLAIDIFSLIYLYKGFMGEDNGSVLLGTTILICIGTYMFISQLGGFLIKAFKKKKRVYYNNLIFVTSINNKFKQTKKIIFISSILVTVTIFYLGFMLSFYITAEKKAVNDSAYHIAYAQIRDINLVSEERIEEIATKNNEKITEHQSLEFIYHYEKSIHNTKTNIILTDKEINKLGKINLKVDKGNYILLRQFDGMRDGEKSVWKKNNLKLYFNGINLEFKNQEIIFKAVFNRSDNNYSHIAVLNEADYNFIKENSKSYYLGSFEFYNLINWKESTGVIIDLENELESLNKDKKKFDLNELDNDERYGNLKLSSRLEVYKKNKQGAALLLFTSSYLGLFFFLATSIILFLKLLSDVDKDKKKFKSMYKIGTSDEEIKKQITRELRPLFFIGPIIGSILAIGHTITFTQDGDQKLNSYFIVCNLLVIAVFFIVQIIYYFICKKVYCEEILQ